MLHSNPQKIVTMKRNILKVFGLTAVAAALVVGCTDLEIQETDSVFLEEEGGGFTGVADPAAAIENIFNDLYGALGDQERFFALQEVPSDEFLVPTRGTDWGDNGVWRNLHLHTWDPNHRDVINTWNQWNEGIFRASEIIDPRSNATPEQLAQAKFIRAFRMWGILDLYGQVPFREVDEGPDVNPRVLSSSEAVDFIIADLDDAIADLPTVMAMSHEDLRLGHKSAARFLKARVLLNKHIYLKQAQADAADMNTVISLIDDIAADGFGLQAGYFDLFKEDPDNETIFWTRSTVGNQIWMGMHYNQNSPDNAGGGWNGFSTLAEFYDLFEGNPNSNYVGDGQEERRGFVPDATTANSENLGIGYGFLIGQQYNEDGTPLETRQGAPLVFTKEFPGLVGNGEAEGIRVIKYHPINGAFTNHKPMFRYSDAHLMKAEAMLRSGGDPTAMVNELRSLRGAQPLSSVGEQELLDERGRELYGEFVRRTDLIRFGKFTEQWSLKTNFGEDKGYLTVFPIPTPALLTNPNLVQNPGY